MANNFGQLLYELRKEKKLTQADLAEMLNVTNKAISKWEVGETFPETAQLIPLSNIFNITIDELLKGRRNEGTGGESSDFVNQTQATSPIGAPVTIVAPNCSQSPVGANYSLVEELVGEPGGVVSRPQPNQSPATNHQSPPKQPLHKNKKVAIIAGGASGGALFIGFIVGMIMLGLILGGVIQCGGRFSVDFNIIEQTFEEEGYTVTRTDVLGTESLQAVFIPDMLNPLQFEEFWLWRYSSNAMANTGYQTAQTYVNLSHLEMTVHRNGLYIWYGTSDALAIFDQSGAMIQGGSGRMRTVDFVIDRAGVIGIPSSQTVREGTRIQMPADPMLQGYVFLGWFNYRQPAGSFNPDNHSSWGLDVNAWRNMTFYGWWIRENEAFLFNHGIILGVTNALRMSNSITIPHMINNQVVTTIGTAAFENAQTVKRISLPATITTINDNFRNWQLREIIVDPFNLHFSSRGGVLYNATQTTLIRVPRVIRRIAIPNTVTAIGDGAFRGSTLETINLPNSLVNIGDWAFAENQHMTSITFPNSLQTIGNNAFYGLSLTSVSFNEGLIEIGGGAFASTLLTTITFPNSLQIIGYNAFSGTNLLNITFGTGPIEIRSWAFSDNNMLTDITLPNGLQSIGYGVFSGSNLVLVTMPSSVVSFSGGAFSGTNNVVLNFLGTEVQWNAAFGTGLIHHLAYLGVTVVFLG